MKAAVLALALSLTPVAAEAWAPRPMPSLHKSAPMRAEAAVAVSGGSDARAGPAGVYDAAVTLGAGKAATPISKLIPLSFLSGTHQCMNQIVAARRRHCWIMTSTPSTRRQLDGVALWSFIDRFSQHGRVLAAPDSLFDKTQARTSR
jgi:hypothetical protein